MIDRRLASTTVRTRVCRGAAARGWKVLATVAGGIPILRSPAVGLLPSVLMALALAPAAFFHTTAHQEDAGSARLAQAKPQPARPASTPAAKPALSSRPSRVERAKTARPASAVTRFGFGDDEVEGDLQRPNEVIVIGGPSRPRLRSLIEIPSSFVTAIAKSLEEL